jgi:hypothetical protein
MSARLLGNSLNLGLLGGAHRSLVLPANLRDKHLYIAGATGTGKSKLLEHLICQDILANRTSSCGMLVIDPHGSLYDNIVKWMAKIGLSRRLILIDMRDAEWVVSYNVLRQRKQGNPSVIVENFVQAMAHVWGQTGTDQTPLFARWAGNTLRALYDRGFTLADAMHLLSDRSELRAAMTRGLTEPIARRDWDMANALKSKDFEDTVGSTVNRLRRFLSNEVLHCTFGQSNASLDLGSAIEDGSIILVSLAREKGRVSKEDAELFATLLLTDLWTAAQERGKRAGVKPFYVYIDEFQRFVTPTIADNLDEARGFGLHLTLAHQFPKQLLDAGPHGRKVYNSVMENASSKIVFRLTDPENLDPLARWLFMGVMDPDQVKHELRSTKVMGYRDEYRTAYSRSNTWGSAYAEHESTSEGSALGSGESFDPDTLASRIAESMSEYSGTSSGASHAHHEAHTEGESEVPVLIPVMGKELSHVQFRSLDEQVHRAMVALFDQGERHYTARLAGMKAPVSLRTPNVDDPLVYPARVRKFVDEQMKRMPFALPFNLALKQLQEREASFAETVVRDAREDQEPRTGRRRVR